MVPTPICRICGTALEKHSLYMLRLCDAMLRDGDERRELEKRLKRGAPATFEEMLPSVDPKARE